MKLEIDLSGAESGTEAQGNMERFIEESVIGQRVLSVYFEDGRFVVVLENRAAVGLETETRKMFTGHLGTTQTERLQ